MMVNIKRFNILAGVAFMITFAAPDARAFPLLCSDPSRLVASARVTMQEIMIIKQEVESNLRIIEEIRNGGFAAAGAMIFTKIQNGDYDRFGKALSNVKTNAKDMATNVAEREWRAKREEELRNSGMSKKEAKAKAQQEAAERMAIYQQAQEEARLKAKEERGSNAFTNSYNWLKNNKSFTSGASSALTGLSNGNWGQALSGAAGATGGALNSNGDTKLGNIFNGAAGSAGNALNSALDGNWGQALSGAAGATGGALNSNGDTKLGNIFNDAAGSAGNALNSAINGDWGNAFNAAADGTGAAVGGATGSQGIGNAIGAIGDMGAGAYDAISNGDGFGGTVNNLVNNSQINSGLSGLKSGYNQLQEEREAARKAAEEERKKQAEETRKRLEESIEQRKKQMNQKMCQDCQENNRKAGKDPMIGCLSWCSY